VPDLVERLLAPLLEAPSEAGVFCDFDGTVARIVSDPAGARPLEGVVPALAALATRFAVVGVISGRPGAFLQEHLGGHGLFLSGLYGLETVTGGKVQAADEANRWRPVVEGVAERADAEMASGVTVERKGLSVTLHFRNDPEREAEVRPWAERAAADTGLVVHPARMSYELRPPVRRDKGTVLEEVARGLGAACFLGDDRGDLEAFDALDRLASSGTSTLRVVVDSAETPPDLRERADLMVPGPEGALALLHRLLDGLR